MRRVEEMKKLALTIFAVSLVLTFAGKGMAADTADVDVTATVMGTCLFTSAGLLEFGSIDPTLPGPYVAAPTSDVNVQCSTGIAWTVVDNAAGAHIMLDGGGNPLPYSFTFTAGGVGAGFGTDVAVGIGATVTQANALAAPPGAYAHTFTLDVTP